MPQILKDTVKDSILESALERFLERGYRDTTMREVADGAGVAAGNIYNYFKNKEEVLTTLLTPVMQKVKALFALDAFILPQTGLADIAELPNRKLEAFIEIYHAHRRVFVLLLEKCDSTKFETVKADVVQNLSAAISYTKTSITGKNATLQQSLLIQAFASSLIQGMITILTQDVDESAKLQAMRSFLPFLRTNLIEALVQGADENEI